MTDNGPPVMWTPTGVSDIVVYTPETGSVHGKRVAFRLWDGTTSFVDIMLKDYNKENVNARIHQAAVAHYEVSTLQGPPLSPNPSKQPPQASELAT